MRAPLCPIQAYMPLALVHVDFTSIETTMGLSQPPSVKNVLVLTDHFTRYAMAFVTKDQKEKLLHEFSMSDSSLCLVCLLNYSVTEVQTSPLHWLKSSVLPFGIQKYRTIAYHVQCNGK